MNPGPFLNHDFGENVSIAISIPESKIGLTVACLTVWWDVTKLILRLHLEGFSAWYGLQVKASGSNQNSAIKVYLPVYTVSYTTRRTSTSIFTHGSKTGVCATSDIQQCSYFASTISFWRKINLKS
jgi:hypothetical protein